MSGGRRRRAVGALTIVFVAGALAVGRAGASEGPGGGQRCGDGTIAGIEACDDGNTVSGDGCSASCTIEQSCYDRGNRFSFFTWSDSYTSAGDSGVMALFEDAVNASRHRDRVRPRFWIAAGDIPFMADGDERLDELNSVISGNRHPFPCRAGNRRFPYFVALGNHDVDGFGRTPEEQLRYWRDYVGSRIEKTLVGMRNLRWGPSRGYDDRTTYSFDYKNAHFVVVNQYHGDPAFPTPDPTACIRPDMLEWIDQDLSRTDRPLRFVVGHEPAWPLCSGRPGYGGEYCKPDHPDRQDPPVRPRPHSKRGSWDEPYGLHWGDSLDDPHCPEGSRDAFWKTLARHRVIAHYVGHSHAYSSRLVEGDGTRRTDIGVYDKTGQAFRVEEGVWEVDNGIAHNSAGTAYVLTTVLEGTVVFEAYDRLGSKEPFQLVESWRVQVGDGPPVAIPTATRAADVPAPGPEPSSSPSLPSPPLDTTPPVVRLTAPEPEATLSGRAVGLLAEASDDDAVAGVQFRVDGEDLGEADTAPPYGLSWDSTRVANGRHVLSAVARDRAGNRTTSEDVAVITSNRPASTRFASGHRVQTAVRFLIRGGPSLANERLGPQPAGALGVVVDGPDFADGSWWWKVDFDDGTDGWAAEDWLEPVPRPQ